MKIEELPRVFDDRTLVVIRAGEGTGIRQRILGLITGRDATSMGMFKVRPLAVLTPIVGGSEVSCGLADCELFNLTALLSNSVLGIGKG